jgi:hypothetical protein
MSHNETIEAIRAFLALPATALPSATWMDSWGDGGSAWPHLRDYLRPEARQRINHMGETVMLRADRDDWRDGITITLS